MQKETQNDKKNKEREIIRKQEETQKDEENKQKQRQKETQI